MKKELPSLGRKVVNYWFLHRHDNVFCRNMARQVIKDALLWKKL